MEIPYKAYESAVQALFEDGCGEPKIDAATALEAAAPSITAREARTIADRMPGLTFTQRLWLMDRVNELDPQ